MNSDQYFSYELEDYLNKEIKNFNLDRFQDNLTYFLKDFKQFPIKQNEDEKNKPDVMQTKSFEEYFKNDELKKHYSFIHTVITLVYWITKKLKYKKDLKKNTLRKIDIVEIVKSETESNLFRNINLYLLKYSNENYVDGYDFLIDAFKALDNKNIEKSLTSLLKKWNIIK